jgi:hypothetical protein
LNKGKEGRWKVGAKRELVGYIEFVRYRGKENNTEESMRKSMRKY